MTASPTVSVVIPTFNRRELVLRAINSVANQSYRDFDIWIVDDGSSDGTEPAVAEYIKSRSKPPIHYLRTSNQGVAAARNLGVKESGGQWIAFLDSDDQWTPDKLEKQLGYAETHPEYQLIQSDDIWIRNGTRVNTPKAYLKRGGDIFLQSLPVCLISPSTVLLSRRLFIQTGGFNEEYPVCEDYELWARITSSQPVGFVPEKLTVKYGGHNDQLSRNHVGIDYWRIKALCSLMKTVSLPESRRHDVLGEILCKARILLNGYLKHERQDEYRAVVCMIREIFPEFPADERNRELIN